MVSEPSSQAALEFIRNSTFLWHQRFRLEGDVYTPGVSNVDYLLEQSGIADVEGATVLDIGTTNGGLAFELERRGAARVVAVDIYGSDRFGLRAIKEFLDSDVEYHCASVYELPRVFKSGFDIVACWGVLYHLRHPLLALDSVRAVTRRIATIETAVCDRTDGRASMLQFHRHGDLHGDASNWFEPTVDALTDMCGSSGLEPVVVRSWPRDHPRRAMVTARPTPGPAEYMEVSYERPLDCRIADGFLLPGQKFAA